MAYASLGILFLLVFVGALFGIDRQKVEDTRLITTNENIMGELTLTSQAFEHNGKIPLQYTCDGQNINPQLSIEGVTPDAKSLVLIMDDPDAVKPAGKVWDHWIVWNIPVTTTEIVEGEEPQGIHGIGSSGNSEYRGPCPPDGEHHYFFKLYTLGIELSLAEGATKEEVEQSMEGHILDQTELIGLYERK